MDAHSERPSSILSLVKRLARKEWASAYERLLDVSGEHRLGTTHTTPQEHLVNLISEMRIVGRASNAASIERLTDSLSRDGYNPNSLLVLLLCADVKREKATSSSHFSSATGVLATDLSKIDTQTQIFTSCDLTEQYLQRRILPVHLWNDNELPEGGNRIAQTARCEHESCGLWLSHNLTGGSADMLVFSNRWNREDPVSVLSTSHDLKPKSKKHNRRCLPIQDRSVQSVRTLQETKELCQSVMHRMFHMCVRGPDFDQRSDLQDSTNPTCLFETSTPTGIKTSCERSRALAWRRRVLKEMKLWVQQLRSSLEQEGIPPLHTRALLCGLTYQSIVSFGPTYLSANSSTVLKAVVSYATLHADSYIGTLLRLVETASADPLDLELITLDTAEFLTGHLRQIGSVLECIEETDGSSESVLNVIGVCLRRFPSSSSLQEMFSYVTKAYEKVLRDWVMEGSCVEEECLPTDESNDSEGDVMNVCLNLTGRVLESDKKSGLPQRSTLFSRDDALFFRRAGNGRAILRNLMLEDSRSSPCASASVHFTDECNQETFAVSTQSFEDESSYRTATDGTFSRVFTNSFLKKSSELQCVSSHPLSQVVKSFFGEKLLVAGTTNSSCWWRGAEKVVGSSKNIDCSTVEAHPTMFAELQVAQFRNVDNVVQRRIFQIFVAEMEVFAHLDFIRQHILLGAGDFANVLVEQINSASSTLESTEIFLRNRRRAALTFYGSTDAGKHQVRSLLHLKRCFRTAMYLFNATTERFVSLLKLELSASKGEALSNGDLWDHQIDFAYEVPNPLKLIISFRAMSMYSKIHAFFIRIHRAKMSLRNVFMITRRRSVLNTMLSFSLLRNKQIQPTLWLFCMDSEQFVNTLGSFFMDQILGSAWESFKGVWASCESVWALRDAHQRFLEGSTQRCLLDPRQKNLRNVMSGGFDIIRNVEKEITKLHESSAVRQVDINTLQDLISSASASLRRRAVFLSDVLERLSEAGTWHATYSMAWG